jgi:hypothetical protein
MRGPHPRVLCDIETESLYSYLGVINNEMIALPGWDKITIVCAKRLILIEYLFKRQ